MADLAEEGWGFPLAGRKWHYFRQGRSLCGRWFFTGRVEPDIARQYSHGSEDCVECHRRRQKELQP